MMEVKEESSVVDKKVRSRRRKGEVVKFELNLRQAKFVVDLSKDKRSLKLVQDLLVKANAKEFGEELSFKDLAVAGIKKLTEKDIEKLKDNSVSSKEKLEIEFRNFQESSDEDIDFWDYLDRFHKQK